MTDRLLPNWLEAYLAYTAQSESPEVYHLWTGISCIAAVLRRNVFFDMGYFLVYPNFYIILVGPAGRCKKSTAMRIGRGIFRDIPGVDFTADSTTRERLIQDLAMALKDGQSPLTAHSSEFASLLTSSQMDMVVFLIDIFDCPPEWSHRTKTGGTQKIVAPFLNLEGATTPEWIAEAMPLGTIGIGLTSRIVFVYQDTPRKRYWKPKLSPEQKQLKELLTNDLAIMASMSGEYTFDSDADHEFDVWNQARGDNPNPSNDSRLNGYYERKEIHLIKLAMIVAASMGESRVITPWHLDKAKKLLEQVEALMPKVFANVGKNPLAVDMEEAHIAIAKAADGLTLGELLDRFKHSVRKEELVEVLDSLIVMKKIIQAADGRFTSLL